MRRGVLRTRGRTERRGPCTAGEAAAVAASLTLVLVAGCLSDGDGGGDDGAYADWTLGLTIDRFDSNGERAVNVTELRFAVRWGPVEGDGWVVQQSDSFVKGNDSQFPFRLEARYEDGSGPAEDFPIMGESSVLTGAVRFVDGKLELVVDGDEGLYEVTDEVDILPHDLERTLTVTGTYGDLRLYFDMREPR